MSVIEHWPDDKPLTLYRYGAEWTSVSRGYPHQDADAKVEVVPFTDTQGAVAALEACKAEAKQHKDAYTAMREENGILRNQLKGAVDRISAAVKELNEAMGSGTSIDWPDDARYVIAHVAQTLGEQS